MFDNYQSLSHHHHRHHHRVDLYENKIDMLDHVQSDRQSPFYSNVFQVKHASDYVDDIRLRTDEKIRERTKLNVRNVQ